MLGNLAVFGAGSLFGAACVIVAAIAFARRDERRERKEAENKQSQREQAQQLLQDILQRGKQAEAGSNSVKERLRQAADITAQQNQIDVRKGNDQVLMHNNLELQKLSILNSILADGFDPVVAIRIGEGGQELPLSKYVSSIKKNLH
jgi:hypothetical protein